MNRTRVKENERTREEPFGFPRLLRRAQSAYKLYSSGLASLLVVKLVVKLVASARKTNKAGKSNLARERQPTSVCECITCALQTNECALQPKVDAFRAQSSRTSRSTKYTYLLVHTACKTTPYQVLVNLLICTQKSTDCKSRHVILQLRCVIAYKSG